MSVSKLVAVALRGCPFRTAGKGSEVATEYLPYKLELSRQMCV